jgi:hypothetical protein
MAIFWHKHHIIPKHAGGTNDKSNLIKVNVALHALLHKILWEENGCLEDKIAWLTLSGQITKAEATMMILKQPKSVEACKKMSVSQKGKPGKFTGKKHTEETKEKMRLKKVGKRAWNKGLTKETSSGLQSISKKLSGIKRQPTKTETKEKLRIAALNQWARQKVA